MHIIMADYDSDWPRLFSEEARRIRAILGGNLLRIFHIGSTSVPGLRAKPVIDMMPVVRDIGAVDACAAGFEAIGYEVMGEFGMPGRRYMRKGGENRTHQVHAFGYDSVTDIVRHLAFRDYLRSHPEACAAYGALKGALAAAHPEDIEAYNDGKDDFVKRMEREALQWYWTK